MMSSSAETAEKRVPPLPQDLQDGGGGGGGGGLVQTEVTVDGLYAQLEQKDKDLTLAAELGNVLLEKNEDLRRQNEALEKEFAENVEVRRTEIDFRRPKAKVLSSIGVKLLKHGWEFGMAPPSILR